MTPGAISPPTNFTGDFQAWLNSFFYRSHTRLPPPGPPAWGPPPSGPGFARNPSGQSPYPPGPHPHHPSPSPPGPPGFFLKSVDPPLPPPRKVGGSPETPPPPPGGGGYPWTSLGPAEGGKCLTFSSLTPLFGSPGSP